MTNRTDTVRGDGTALHENAVPADAFIYPDDPLVEDTFRAALIHPDEPFQPREVEAGIVVGMSGSNGDRSVDPGAVPLDLARFADLLEAVSMELRRDGIASLRPVGQVPSVETDLKNHLAEYFRSITR